MSTATKPEKNPQSELHSGIWSIADSLRGSLDSWDFKNYVLGMMFYRFISENLEHYMDDYYGKQLEGFKYRDCSDEDAEHLRDKPIVEKGFFILPSALFCNICEKAQDVESQEFEKLAIKIKGAFDAIIASTRGISSEKDFKGLFDDFDISSSKLGNTTNEKNKRLLDLMNGIAKMDISYKDNDIDAFGDAYEFLMKMYASNAGKSGGEFFTPQEVSKLLTKLAVGDKEKITSVYDMCCGSGSLLIQAAKVLGKDNVGGFYGQEINNTTYNLCRINMFLHDIPFNKFDIRCGNTLFDPLHYRDSESNFKGYEAIVSNPPYSIKWDTKAKGGRLLEDPRFSPAGALAPQTKADLAFIMHAMHHLAENGTAAIVCFPGVLYRTGAEEKIRTYLIKENFVDAVIQMPSDLFFGTTITTSIMVLKKNRQPNDKILFIDASKEFERKDRKARLTDENINTIYQQYAAREDVPYRVKAVDRIDVESTNYNLSVAAYVDIEDTREKIDIKKLNAEIEAVVKKQNELRTVIDNLIKMIEQD